MGVPAQTIALLRDQIMPTIPTPADVDNMNVKSLVEFLRKCPEPSTGAERHSKTLISRIAGASAGWADMVLKSPPGPRGHNVKFERPLRRYVRELLETKGDLLRLLMGPDLSKLPSRRERLQAIPTPPPEPPKPKVDPKVERFMTKFGELRDKLFADAESIDELLAICPPMFRDALLKLQAEMACLTDSVKFS